MDKHDRTRRVLWTWLLVSMLLAGLLSGCAQPTPDAAQVAQELAAIYATQTAQAQAAATFTPTTLPEDAVVIPDTTQVLADTELANLTSISDDLAVFTFAESSEQLASLKQNDVIVGDVSDQAPDGFLRRVESITTDGGQVIVLTAPARLEDAIDTGALAITEDLKPTDVRAGWKRPGVELSSLAPPALPTNWHVALVDVVLLDLDGDHSTTSDQIRADGALDFTTRLDFDLKIAWFQIERLSVVASANETVNLRISGDVPLLNVREEVQVAYFPLNPITFMIGPVPVVLTPILTVNVGLDGTAHVGFVAGVTQTFSASAGVRYENKRWQPIAQFKNDFKYLPPQVTGNLQVGAYGSVQLAVLIYGVGGPWASLDGNFGLDVNIQRSPPWRLYGGLRCRAGVRAEILGYKLAGQLRADGH